MSSQVAVVVCLLVARRLNVQCRPTKRDECPGSGSCEIRRITEVLSNDIRSLALSLPTVGHQKPETHLTPSIAAPPPPPLSPTLVVFTGSLQPAIHT
uniref:Putative secreted protein n=1 Tax=Anopheles triannulatus TaxID=58253 RepID=A0A2M4B6F7_9DIPT